MMIEYWCSHCDKHVQARITEDSIESPEEIDLTNALCEECDKNGEFPRYSDLSQCNCDACNEFVGITGLTLIWALLEDEERNLEMRPKLLCSKCMDLWEQKTTRRIENPGYCLECGEDDISLSEYWDPDCKRWFWLCERCAKDGGYWEEYY